MSTNKYYLYAYIDPYTQTPFYIGIGHGKRYLSHIKEARTSKKSNHKLNKIRKIIQDGTEPIIKIWFDQLTKEDAKSLEISYIKLFGRLDKQTGCLVNLTSGGDGHVDWSKEMRQKMSNINSGIIMAKDSSGHIHRISKDDPRWTSGELVGMNKGSVNSNVNGKLSGYILAKDHNGNTYRVKKDDPRWISGELVGINKNKKAHHNTIEAAKARKGHKRKPESIEKGRTKLLGKPKSEEHKKKLSEAIKNLPKIECTKCGKFFSRPNHIRHTRLNKCH